MMTRRWRRWGVLALGAAVAGPCLWVWLRSDEWPARATIGDRGDTWPLAFTPDGRTIATANSTGVSLWDAGSGVKRRVLFDSLGVGGGRAVFAPDGRTMAVQVAAIPRPSSIALVDAASGRVRLTLPTPHIGLYDLAFVDGGRHVRALLGDVPNVKLLRTWDATTGAEVANVAITDPPEDWRVALAPDGRTLALSKFNDAQVRLWDVAAGRQVAVLSDPTRPMDFVGGLAFSPDNRTLAVGRENGPVELWDVATGSIRRRLAGHSDGFGSDWISFAPDGLSIASSGPDRRANAFQQIVDGLAAFLSGRRPGAERSETIAVDLATGRTMARATSAIHPRFSPDGRWVATREADLGIRIRPNPVPPR